MHTHIIIKAQDKTCDFGACVAMTSPRVKRCKVEPEHADDGDDDDLHENKCQPLAAVIEDAELNAVVKDCWACGARQVIHWITFARAYNKQSTAKKC